MSKAQFNARLSEQARMHLDLICGITGTNQTAAVEMALALLAAQLTKGENGMNKKQYHPGTRLLNRESGTTGWGDLAPIYTIVRFNDNAKSREEWGEIVSDTYSIRYPNGSIHEVDVNDIDRIYRRFSE